MIDIDRRTIAELFARYELEPELADVFVEGTFDREILVQSLNEVQSGYTFYEIDVIDIPQDILKKHRLSCGNKQRVIALARELSTLPDNVQYQCLVDKDLDHWFGSLEATPRLRWTNYCSIELHFFTQSIINHILITVGRAKINQVDVFIDSLKSVLRLLYALRLTDRQCAMMLKWVALKKYLSTNGDVICFDLDKYKIALLTSNKLCFRKHEFDKFFNLWLERLDCDVCLCARGHDFQELLAWSMGEYKGQREFATKSAIERLFVALAHSVSTLHREFSSV